MKRTIKCTAVAALAVSAVVVLPAGLSPTAAADPVATPTATAEAAQENVRPLIEMITADKKGRFYTLNSNEAATAERVNGFTRTDESRGISMFNRKAEGTIPVHRLRLRSGHQAYLLATSPDEIKRLSDPSNPKRQFDDEGVLGYIYQRAQGDETFKLVRYTKNGDWRVSVENRADLLDAGFRVDGPLGHVPTS